MSRSGHVDCLELTAVRKRSLDLVLGSVFAILTLPLVAASALLVAASLRTVRPFFVQRRVGRGGKEFRLVKIRTLPVSFPRDADKHLIARTHVPRACRAIRQLHLDELPQLWSVVGGTMSLVGPRPEMPRLVADFDPDFARLRAQVRPGCTGLWQLSVDAPGLIGEAPQYDLYYLAHGGVRLDLWIVARTVRDFFSGRHTLVLSEVPSFAHSSGLVDEDLRRELLEERVPAHA